MKQFNILDWIKLLWNRLSLWAGLCKCSWNKIIVIQWRQLTNMSALSQCYQPVETRYRRQLTNMSDLTLLSACLEPISKVAHKYVRPHSVISLLRPDIEGSSQMCQTSKCYQPVETRHRRQLTDIQTSQCYQPVETRNRRQLTNMSDLTVLSACWDPISKAAHKYVRPCSVISLLRPDIEGSSQICQTSQCYQPVETRYRRQLTNMSDLTVLSACWDPISKAAHKYVRPHSVISLLRPDIEGSSQICQTSHSVIGLLKPDIEDNSQICQISQCCQPVETRYRRQLTDMSDLTVSSACWDAISKAAHKYVRPHNVISLLRPDIEGSSQIC